MPIDDTPLALALAAAATPRYATLLIDCRHIGLPHTPLH